MILQAEFRDQVGHAGARDGGLELVRLRDGPLCHVTPVGPSANRQTLRIGNAAIDEILHACHNVFEITASPIPAVGLNEFLSIPYRAPNIWIKDCLAVCGQELAQE